MSTNDIGSLIGTALLAAYMVILVWLFGRDVIGYQRPPKRPKK